MKLSNTDVQQIIQLLDDSEYDNFEIETEEFKLILRRGKTAKAGWSQEKQTLTSPKVIGIGKTAVKESRITGEAVGDDERALRKSGLTEIPAPVVGTFYRAPQPGTPPFVEPGSRVRPDTVIAIIEVMKLMNSVTAGVAGEVVDICVEDAGFVEQGQCLMRIRPDVA